MSYGNSPFRWHFGVAFHFGNDLVSRKGFQKEQVRMSNVNFVLLLLGIIAIVAFLGALYVNYKDEQKKKSGKSH